MKISVVLIVMMMAAGMAVAQNAPAAEKVTITVTPPKTEPFVFPGYSVEKITLVTDRGVMIPWRVTLPK